MSNWLDALETTQFQSHEQVLRIEKGMIDISLGGQTDGTLSKNELVQKDIGIPFEPINLGWRAVKHIALDGDHAIIEKIGDLYNIPAFHHGHPAGGRPGVLYEEYQEVQANSGKTMTAELLEILEREDFNEYSLAKLTYALSGWGAMAAIIIAENRKARKTWGNLLHVAILPSIWERRGAAIQWWIDNFREKLPHDKVVLLSADAASLAVRPLNRGLNKIEANLIDFETISEGDLSPLRNVPLHFQDVDFINAIFNGVLLDAMIRGGLKPPGDDNVKCLDILDLWNEFAGLNTLSVFPLRHLKRMPLEKMVTGTACLPLQEESIEKVTLIIPANAQDSLIRPPEGIDLRILKSEALNKRNVCLAINCLSEKALETVELLSRG